MGCSQSSSSLKNRRPVTKELINLFKDEQTVLLEKGLYCNGIINLYDEKQNYRLRRDPWETLTYKCKVFVPKDQMIKKVYGTKSGTISYHTKTFIILEILDKKCDPYVMKSGQKMEYFSDIDDGFIIF